MFGLFDGKSKRNKKLREATSGGSFSDIASLIKRGVDIDEPEGDSGENALTIAIMSGRSDIVELLLSSGADVNFVTSKGNAPLLFAAYKGDINIDVCRRLLDSGASVNLSPSSGQCAGVTALYLAASKGAEKISRLLLDAGADASVRLPEGQSLMYAAAMGGNPKVIKLLKERGVETNGKERGGRRPIHIATAADKPKAVQCLIELGVPVDQLSDEKETPLLVAAMNDNVASARVLVENRADVSYSITPVDDRISPLLLAVTYGFDNLAKLLLDAGADPEALVRGDKTILDYAKASKRKSTIRLLEARVSPTIKSAKAKSKLKEITKKPKVAAVTSTGAIVIPRFTVDEPAPTATQPADILAFPPASAMSREGREDRRLEQTSQVRDESPAKDVQPSRRSP